MNLPTIRRLMRRSRRSHKGQHGHVLVIGGSEDYVGTLAFVGLAALRAGCDLVTIAAPEKVAWAINCSSPDLITKKLPGKFLAPGHLKLVAPLLRTCDVLAVGNGAGLRKETKAFFRKLMKTTRGMPKVIDADAIKALSLQEIENAIITPHAAELQLLLRNSGLSQLSRVGSVSRKAQALRRCAGSNVLLLKGPADYLVSRTMVKKVTGGNPGMARGGMGDVLAGLCAGFLAQAVAREKVSFASGGRGARRGQQARTARTTAQTTPSGAITSDLMRSAEAASFINKRIGDLLLKKKRGYSFIAGDVVEEMRIRLGRAIKGFARDLLLESRKAKSR